MSRTIEATTVVREETEDHNPEIIPIGSRLGTGGEIFPSKKHPPKDLENATFHQEVKKIANEEKKHFDDILNDVIVGTIEVKAPFTPDDLKVMGSRCVLLSRIIHAQRNQIDGLKKKLDEAIDIVQKLKARRDTACQATKALLEFLQE